MKKEAANIRYEMHGGLAEKEALEVFARLANSALRLMRNQKIMSRIADSAILVSETNKK